MCQVHNAALNSASKISKHAQQSKISRKTAPVKPMDQE